MNKIIIQILLMLFYGSLFAQDYTGVWEGWFASDLDIRAGRRTFFMHMEIKQHGRDIVGMFYNAAPELKSDLHVVYKLSGIVSKENKDLFRLINNGVVENNLPNGVADVFLELYCTYNKTDTADIIKGIWYPNPAGISRRSDGAGGPFILKRISRKPSAAGEEIIEENERKIKTYTQ